MKYWFGLALSLVVVLSVPQVARAFESASEDEVEQTVLEKRVKRQEAMEEKAQELEEMRAEKRRMMCEQVKVKMANRRSWYENSNSKHRQAYEAIGMRLTNLVARLKSKGCGEYLGQVEADMTEFDSLVAALKTAVDTFFAAWSEADLPMCQDEPTEFRDELSQARTKFAGVKTASGAIKSFVRGTLKPDLKKATELCKAARPDARPTPLVSPTSTPALLEVQ